MTSSTTSTNTSTTSSTSPGPTTGTGTRTGTRTSTWTRTGDGATAPRGRGPRALARRAPALAALGAVVALGLSACGLDSPGMPGMDHGSTPAATAPASTAGGGYSSPGATFDAADVTFVQGMVPHHEQAVAMSRTLLGKDGVSAGTTALARQVEAAQQPEIDTMKGWLQAWGQPAGGMDHGGHDKGGMGGMAGDADLAALDAAQGAEAEKLYLQLMTRHHEGAVAMAETEVRTGRNPDATALARSIETTQRAEIATMKDLLARL